MAACRNSSKNTRKINIKLVLNKTLPWAQMESELDVFGVSGKFVKYLVHSFIRKNWKKNILLHTRCPNCNGLVFGLKEF
jgi:hypothetical protein